jgi:hypothetical protein
MTGRAGREETRRRKVRRTKKTTTTTMVKVKVKRRMRPLLPLRRQCRIALRVGLLKHTYVVTDNGALQAQGR